MRGIPQTSIGAYTKRRGMGGLGDGDLLDYFGNVDDSGALQDAIDAAYSGADSSGIATTPAAQSGGFLDTLKSLGTTVSSFLTSAQALDQQKKLLEINQQRAAQGLAPISSASLAPTVNVGISPEIKSLLLYGAIGLGGAWAFSQFTKRRRR